MSTQQDNAPRAPGNGTAKPLTGVVTTITGPWNRENLVSWVRLILFMLAVMWLLIQPFRIPSDSMWPTLNGDTFLRGDRVIVNKLVFGPHVPFTNRRLFSIAKPKRWDIVVFRSVVPEESRKILIKRVAGLPGEEVLIHDGRLFVNGEAVPWAPGMPDDMHYLRADGPYYGCLPVPELSVIPEGHYFMLGDNTAHSTDSRFFGWVPEENILGRATCIWWPLNRLRDLTGWTATWWGMLLLYGIPSIIVLQELLRTFVLQAWRIRPSGNGRAHKSRRILVNLTAYGVRLPFTDIRILRKRMPQRGDRVIYRAPDGSELNGATLLGQIAALPGECLSVADGRIVADGKQVGVAPSTTAPFPEAWRATEGVKVPEGHYVILNDGATEGPDSRDVGFVPGRSIWGEVMPVRRMSRLYEFIFG